MSIEIKRDFHAKTHHISGDAVVVEGKAWPTGDESMVFLEKDVLRERAAYEKEIEFYKSAMNANAKSAEAAERQLDMEKRDSKGWNERAEKAEARVKELEHETNVRTGSVELLCSYIFNIRNEVESLNTPNKDDAELKRLYCKKLEMAIKDLQTLAGEKTK